MEKRRELWVDNVKVIACILVLLGHLMQSMAFGGIIPIEGFFTWFNQTVYYFHVPLFFICSGYLHQKLTRIDNGADWFKNILQKLVNLGVPYVAFTIAVWLVKSVFSGAGNNKVGGLLETLFLQPTAPYWYLYCLFFIFLITGIFKNMRQTIIGICAASVMKAISIFEIAGGGYCYAVSTVLANEIWFVLGMVLCFADIPKRIRKQTLFVGLGFLFISLSVVITVSGIRFKGMNFLMGLVSCTAVVGTTVAVEKNHMQSVVMSWLAQYTMPIFLMHSIFAATLRSVLLKIGITTAWIHIPLGITISIAGPVIVAVVMKKLKYPEFLLYPGKFIKIK